MRTFTLLGFIALTLGFATTTRAADGTPLWTNVYNNYANGTDVPHAMAIDTNGDVYVTGYSFIAAANGLDFNTIKITNSGGNTWYRPLNGAGSGDDEAVAVAVDGLSNVFVTGKSQSVSNGYDFLTVKYNLPAALQWRAIYNSSTNADDVPTAMALDTDGDICVTGVTTLAGVSTWTTLKYATNGTLTWARTNSGAGNGPNQANAIATDLSDGVYVTGYTTGSAGNLDYTTLRYTSGGTLVWKNIYDGTSSGDDAAVALALDTDGSVYVTGYSFGIGGSYDFATIKYSASGSGVWTNIFNGTGNSDDEPVALAVDTNKNVYVTGTSYGAGGGFGCVTIKYSNTGAPVWTNFFDGVGNSGGQATSLAVDAGGNVYVAATTLGGLSQTQFVTLKYSTSGLPVWTNFFKGGSSAAITVDAAGNCYVTGGTGDFVTIKYSAPLPPFYFVTTNGNFGSFSNKFVMGLVGPPGSNAVVSASTNLINWTPIITNLLPSGTLQITDAVSPSSLRRFYHAQLQ